MHDETPACIEFDDAASNEAVTSSGNTARSAFRKAR